VDASLNAYLHAASVADTTSMGVPTT